MKTVFVPLVGRLGNLLFIYAHARAWAEQNGYVVSTYPWVGERVFEIPIAPRPEQIEPTIRFPENMRQNQESLIYTRSQVRSWFKFKPEVLEKLEVLDDYIPKVLLEVRQAADYIGAGLVVVSRQSYEDACVREGYSLEDARWELDTSPTRLPSFTGDPSGAGLGTSEVCLPSFYRMMKSPVHFRANSTYSWWAATLGDAKVYAPVIRGLQGGFPGVKCDNFVCGNWPVMADVAGNTDLHLKD